ncbi:ATP-dependent DNA helicase RecG [Clostridium grantii]|uniref:ATP-dependent DNA helicase RecG n=1 Tax=Clostridium grantii DSM 8605 TaxID=1121316 RepID=A0A1M5QTW9_9CLOT|nr:ATP-dependent DNA helicase RecG [Clostridium grantii]SHH17587.1 ATP-dependent DNA helicase RecG [Clostridium grantii DSM 8605]
MNISDNIENLKGVGKKTAQLLNKLNIKTILDLILYFPTDYETLSLNKKISNCEDKEKISLECLVESINKDIRVKGNMIISSIVLNDGETTFIAKWFNQPYIKKGFLVNNSYNLSGTIKIQKNGSRVLMNAKILGRDKSGNSISPKYQLTKGLTNNFFYKYTNEALNSFVINENLPQELLSKFSLCSLDFAIRKIHKPDTKEELKLATDRLKFQELFAYSIKIGVMKEKRLLNNQGIPFKIAPELINLKEKLPFQLTEAQSKAVREILIDSKKPVAMNRLLQGDVGSGKTVVALIVIFNAIFNGYQAVMMAPTEILAKQHYLDFIEILKDFSVRIAFLASSTSNKEKISIKEKLKAGELDLVIGTHALIEDNVEFENLGIIVTDEQHRFGVNQRARLYNKRVNTDVLVMSATPIPRTLSLCLYGDLDVSIIDKLPPGRKKIDTFWFSKKEKGKVYDLLSMELKEGRQGYVVCPLVEENETMELNSVQQLSEELRSNNLKGFVIESLYGKMKQKEKDAIMERFKNKEIDVLVSTTVIEVGVNVPNSTVMIIEDAERFGLSQLHQLRGRVGRGKYKSYCYLIADGKSQVTKQRMETMVKSNDGFYIAEQDLKIRGSGQVFGIKQHGDENFMLANPIDDMKILICASEEAKKIMKSAKEEDILLKTSIAQRLESEKKLICFN